MQNNAILLGLVLFLAAGTASVAQPVQAPGAPAGIMTQKAGKLTVFAGGRGLTLYTYDNDAGGKPSCYDFCARTWLPLLTGKDAMMPANWSLVARTDGSTQIAYKGKPLYFYTGDNPGDVSGDGMDGLWHAAKP